MAVIITALRCCIEGLVLYTVPSKVATASLQAVRYLSDGMHRVLGPGALATSWLQAVCSLVFCKIKQSHFLDVIAFRASVVLSSNQAEISNS